ncbi:MAG: site-specific integrase [Gemmatimonadota bacterium]|nr:site-specific integrase [Gemmatimonadota bacterium]MDE2870086.1 site-specific integrase [Gemmatimonadota bacterium]
MIPTSPATPSAASHADHTPFETVAEEVFRRYGRVWKPATLKVNRVYLRNQILPWFAGRPVGEVTRAEVRRWFGTLRATPAAANRSIPILSVIMRGAAVYGRRAEGTNPCKGIRRYPEPRRERFLTSGELRRLGRELADAETGAPLRSAVIRLLALTGCRQSEIRTLGWGDYREGHLFLRDGKTALDAHRDRGSGRQQAAIIRLLLLTGCRKGELVHLRWEELDGNVLRLADSKTGPRIVFLSEAARTLLAAQPRGHSPYVFPSPKDGSRPRSAELSLWRKVRRVARIEDVRLHDLRHTFASHAVMQRVPLPVVARLLGHSGDRMALGTRTSATARPRRPPSASAPASPRCWTGRDDRPSAP